MDQIIEWAKEIQSIAQAGLFYGHDVFDKERYERLRQIAAEMMETKTDLSMEKVRDLFCSDVGYQTPKVDTRGAIFQEDKLLLVQEADGRWSLPGGWCEYNLSPMQNVIKEVREEAGLDVKVVRLIAALDRDQHNQPPYAYGVTKLFYLCEAVGGEFTPNIETLASGYFAEDELPEMSVPRCSLDQVKLCFAAHRAEHWEAVFD